MDKRTKELLGEWHKTNPSTKPWKEVKYISNASAGRLAQFIRDETLKEVVDTKKHFESELTKAMINEKEGFKQGYENALFDYMKTDPIMMNKVADRITQELTDGLKKEVSKAIFEELDELVVADIDEGIIYLKDEYGYQQFKKKWTNE